MEQLNIQNFQGIYKRIDHVAIAVHDLEASISFYCDILGFNLLERRETKGKFSGMISAVIASGNFTIVLIQGTEADSQVCQYVREYGPGVQHVALEVDNLDKTIKQLSEKGIEFATEKISSPGLYQIFSKRDKNSGMMIEFIERRENDGFSDNNVQNLFDQLEESGTI